MWAGIRPTVPAGSIAVRPFYFLLLPLPSSTDGSWHRQVFAGKDPSRALASSSLKPEDCRPDWYDLDDKEKTVLDEWFTFFSKRYNIVGKVKDATNY